MNGFAPEHAFAVVVGVDEYGLGVGGLEGPVADALRFTDLLSTCGVPGERIRLFIDSPKVLEAHGVPAGVPISRPTQAAISDLFTRELPGITASELIVFWGGHGAIGRESRRVFLTGASLAVPTSLDLNDLIRFLGSERFLAGRFARQIVIADVCANVFGMDNGVPGTTFASQPPRQGVEQFVLYAASPGQKAANMDSEKTGLLSRELFASLKDRPAGEWPWKMDEVARELQGRFLELRAKGLTKQAPTYLWTRDWEGADTTFGQPMVPAPVQAVVDTPRPTLAELMRFAKALVEIPSFRNPSELDQVLLYTMRPEVKSRMVPANDPLSNARRLITLCLDYPPSLRELMDGLAIYEGDSTQMQKAWRVYHEVSP